MKRLLRAAGAIAGGVLALGCGALVNEDADRALIEADRVVLEARIAELEATLTAPQVVPTPSVADRLVLRQFVRPPDPTPAGASAVELCLELFGRGDLIGGIPPTLTTACVPIAPPAGGSDPVEAIAAVLTDPVVECWAAAVPGTNLPPCWR
ncbi:MAG: hypothetical protein O3B31_11980 [Chloroflexi bacterium]|nr:hypothetical protein [Chloroflexota bacterium]MDA1004043.1 hypothetical protein [Chloroflexota bacterium]